MHTSIKINWIKSRESRAKEYTNKSSWDNYRGDAFPHIFHRNPKIRCRDTSSPLLSMPPCLTPCLIVKASEHCPFQSTILREEYQLCAKYVLIYPSGWARQGDCNFYPVHMHKGWSNRFCHCHENGQLWSFKHVCAVTTMNCMVDISEKLVSVLAEHGSLALQIVLFCPVVYWPHPLHVVIWSIRLGMLDLHAGKGHQVMKCIQLRIRYNGWRACA